MYTKHIHIHMYIYILYNIHMYHIYIYIYIYGSFSFVLVRETLPTSRTVDSQTATHKIAIWLLSEASPEISNAILTFIQGDWWLRCPGGPE